MAQYGNFNDSLRQPEKLYADDGLLDLLLGAAFIAAALAMWYGVVWLVSILPITILFFWPSIKERITAPRLTDQELHEVCQLDARNRQRKLLVLTMLAGTLVLGLFTLFVFQIDAPWVDRLWPFVMIGVGLLVLALPGYAFDARRFYLYAGVSLAGWLLCYGLAIAAPVAVALPGVMLLLGGIYCLSAFLRTHPKVR